MLALEIIENPEAAAVALDPIRSRLLAELAEPASAATLAMRVGLTRQKVNYHLNALQAHGLVEAASQKKWGGLTERLLVATASQYVVSPVALGAAGADPGRPADRLSASYLVAVAARVIREVGGLMRAVRDTGKRLPTLSVDTEICFRSAAERAEFSKEILSAIATLAAKYHDESAPDGRPHRLLVLAHPLPKESAKEANNVDQKE